MLTVRNLSILHNKDLRPLIKDLSFTLSGTERLAVIGEEGNGKSALLQAIVCPEKLGGLPTPRLPSERLGDRVVSSEGADVTAEFRRGAEEALRICREHGCGLAVLKAKSPSCGKGLIHNGLFDGGLVPGNGMTAQLLTENRVTVMTEQEWLSSQAIF